MRVSVKMSLVVVVGLLTAFLVGLGGISVRQMGQMNAASDEVETDWLPSIRALADVKYTITRYRLIGARHVLSTDGAAMAELDRRLDETRQDLDRGFAKYAALISSDEERRLWASFREEWQRYVALQDEALVASRKNASENAARVFAETSKLFSDALAVLDRDIALNDQAAAAAMRLVESEYQTARRIVIVVSGVALLVAAAAVAFVLFGVTGPLHGLNEAMAHVSQGRLDTVIPSVERRNEIGDMARTLVVFRDGLADAERLRRAQIEREAEAARRLVQERHAIADRFMATMGSLASNFVKSSSEVADAARNLSATAEETAVQAQSVSQAAEEAATNVETVAASTEEMAASVRQINEQVRNSTRIAETAADEAAATEANIRGLSEAAEKIGDVVNLIRDIAGQTNLLALNATIEAARAGEAGKGFAVVASEVKQLAAQTARATDEIGQKIGEIQSATAETVGSIARIVGTIGTIREVTGIIADAVSQQGAATDEISGNTHRAAQGAGLVTENIAGVGHAAEMTGSASTQLMGLSDELSRRSADLTREVESFVGTLRAG
mgnify:CR=1 FL=1